MQTSIFCMQLSGRRTPRPGPPRVCVCVPLLAGLGGPPAGARLGAPHPLLWPLCPASLFGPLRAGVALFVVLAVFCFSACAPLLALAFRVFRPGAALGLDVLLALPFSFATPPCFSFFFFAPASPLCVVCCILFFFSSVCRLCGAGVVRCSLLCSPCTVACRVARVRWRRACSVSLPRAASGALSGCFVGWSCFVALAACRCPWVLW